MMLVFTKLLILSAIILLIIGAAVYLAGYGMSGNTSIKYYKVSSGQPANSTVASSNFVQNGWITLKVLGLFMLSIGLIFILCAAVNEKLKLSQKFHHLKYSKPLH